MNQPASNHVLMRANLFARGFSDPVRDTQRCYRTILRAMSEPGRAVEIQNGLQAPAPLSPAGAAILLTLADASTLVHLVSPSPAAWLWLEYHCAASRSALDQADFIHAVHQPPLTGPAGPDASNSSGSRATLILETGEFPRQHPFYLSGAGAAARQPIMLPIDQRTLTEWRANQNRSGREIDILLCVGRKIIGLPRNLRIEPA